MPETPEISDALPPSLALAEIEQLIATGDLDDAVDAADTLVAQYRTAETVRALAKALFERATATYDEAEYDEALRTIGAAAALATEDRARADLIAERALMLTGGVFITAEREQEAARAIKEAYALDRVSPTVLMNMALLRDQPAIGASRAEAIIWVEEAIAQAQLEGTEEWMHWSMLAHLLEEEGETARAADAYERMLALFPFETNHPLEFVMRQQRKHLQTLRGERITLFDAGSFLNPP